MALLTAWKHGLELFKPNNIKQFARTVIQTLPQVYKNWFTYSWWALIVISMVSFVFYKVSYIHLRVAFHSLLISSALLAAYVVILLYTCVMAALTKQPFSWIKNKKHIAYGTLFIAIAISLLLYGFYSIPMEIIEAMIFTRERLEAAVLAGKDIPQFVRLVYANPIEPGIMLMYLFLLFIYIEIAINYLAFLLLAFLDEVPSIRGFARSIIKSIKFVIYNFPLLLILFGIWYGIYFLISYPFYNAFAIDSNESILNKHFYVMPLVFFVEITFMMPIMATIWGQIYRLYKNND